MSSVQSTDPKGLSGRQRHLAVFTILLGIALTVLDSTAVTLGLPVISSELGLQADQAIWIVNGFQLAALVALLPLANWGDRITYRRVYLTGAILWGSASVLTTLSDSLVLLIAARAAQGLGAAGIMAVNMALVRLTWPPALLGRGIALNSIVVSTATVVGPLLAAAVLSLGSWRWLFAINIPASLLLFFIGYRALPSNQPEKHQAPPSILDISLNAGMFVLLFLTADRLGHSAQSTTQQNNPWALDLFFLAAFVVVTVIHVGRQRGKPSALLPLDLFRIPLFRFSMLTSIGSFSAQTITFIVLPFLMMDTWRISASETGMLMSCWPVGTILAASFAGRWIGRFHGGLLGGIGMLCLALGLACLAWTAFTSSQTLVPALSLFLCGIGFGLFQSPNNHTIITSAPNHRSGAASAMIGTARLTGQTLGATLFAMVFLLEGESNLHSYGVALMLACVLSLAAGFSSFMRVRY